MGRQSHIARLALGRSPFGPPLEDEKGDFIIGPNAQRQTDHDYIQQFDDRGHPRNLASETLRRRLLRAQNEALSTVGVVVRKAQMQRSWWQSMSDMQRYRLLLDEHATGAYCEIVETIAQNVATHWIINFRRRLLTFKSYLGLPIPQMLFSEWNIMGPSAFLFAGFFPGTIARVSQLLRVAILEDERIRISKSMRPSRFFSLSNIGRLLRWSSLQVLWFAFEYPFHAYSVLQSLYLIPLHPAPSWSAMIPFSSHSPIRMSLDASDLFLGSSTQLLVKTISSPFVLALVRDLIGNYLFKKVYVIVRQMVAKPDRPDRISLQSARNLNLETASVELEEAIFGDSGEMGPRSMRETIQAIIPASLWFWVRVIQTQRVPLAVELSPNIEIELLGRSAMHYRALYRQNRELDLRRAPRTLRVMAIRAAFHDFNLDPDHSMIDIFELADDVSFLASSSVSTSTPEPENLTLFTEAVTGPGTASEARGDTEPEIAQGERQSGNNQTVDNANAENLLVWSDTHEETDDPDRPLPFSGGPTVDGESVQPTVPLETLLEPVLHDTADSGELRPASPVPATPDQGSPVIEIPSQGSPLQRTPSPISPIPGISRAASLPHTTPRPVRRPTVIEQDAPAMGDEMLQRRQPQSKDTRKADESLYRVTVLSNHPAEAFAHYMTSIIESIVLLPLDIMFLRSLTRGFLTQQSEDQHMARASSLLSDVWPLTSGLGVRDLSMVQRLQFWGNFFLTIGMQGLVNFVIWSVGTQATVSLGERFGWGNI
ncbi:uncharacterized protein Z520_06459 [Fonsecaea multimorphosa CBS 102226]|uniref:Uncharacterized protein n=1 Tax=Fonsecaea multimorphosa CBS 102226 TaxID=1442371 RepID=A0A0D2IKZ4_9EURO|nr:uncharacterized protein Z520_06459 [Fonsecaea multimorphosa CBS 102226]KIX97681.1 hypothetical protein Z520_06459 [Fonsecaea multimorphosa CBS 102226]OAL23999.1 hypothetical protein AYO22_06023 [Fonsecaea multimorphosa]